MSPTRILVIDDDVAMCELLVEHLGEHYPTDFRTGAALGLTALASEVYSVVITDLNMPGMNGIEFCQRILEGYPGIAVIVITAFGSLKTATAALRVGAYDFISKPFELEELQRVVDRACTYHELRQEVRRLHSHIDQSHVRGLTGHSPAITAVRRRVMQAAATPATVLIRGERGSGKEVVARAIHAHSPRADQPFVAVNLAAMSRNTLEVELFGHVSKDIHTSAGQRKGRFLTAQGGTLFLDEIGALPLELQPALLRVLEQGTVRPVGSDADVPFDARIICATNRDLESAVEEECFRDDLYWRLNVFEIEAPPLRTRGDDILQLAQAYLSEFARQSDKQVVRLSPEAAARLLSYHWPGNVRELKNCIQQAVALADYEALMVANLPERVQAYRSQHVLVFSDNPDELVPLETVEKRYILRVLKAVGGHRTKAAKILGVGRKTLYRKLERYGYSDDQTAI